MTLPAVLVSADCTDEALVVSLAHALPCAISRVQLVTIAEELSRREFVYDRALEAELVLERPRDGNASVIVDLQGPIARMALADFYTFVDRWARQLNRPLIVADGPSIYYGKRFAGHGSWEWVQFQAEALDSESQLFVVEAGAVSDEQMATVARCADYPLGALHTDHFVGSGPPEPENT